MAVGHSYLTESGTMNYNDFAINQPGQRNYGPDILATIYGTVNPDLSAVVDVLYNDGVTPSLCSYSFGGAADGISYRPGGALVFGNSSGYQGPYYHDNLVVTAVPEPSASTTSIIAVFSIGLQRCCSRRVREAAGCHRVAWFEIRHPESYTRPRRAWSKWCSSMAGPKMAVPLSQVCDI